MVLVMVLVPVEIKFMKPEVTACAGADDLSEKVILFDNKALIRIKVGVKFGGGSPRFSGVPATKE